jgi:hypothetical protein
MTFYPYNYGKQVCTGPAPDDHCLTKRVEMGHHVGDWELITIRFFQGKPNAVHVGSHGNDFPDTAFTFRAPRWTVSGSKPDGPVLEWEGDHPIVYSAGGSHGIYAWGGKHNYKTTAVGDELNDYTGKGIRWETWGSIIWADDSKYSVLLNVYEGRWGNPHMGKNGCEISIVPEALCGPAGIPKDEYQLNDGPSLPDRQRDKSYLGAPSPEEWSYR